MNQRFVWVWVDVSNPSQVSAVCADTEQEAVIGEDALDEVWRIKAKLTRLPARFLYVCVLRDNRDRAEGAPLFVLLSKSQMVRPATREESLDHDRPGIVRARVQVEIPSPQFVNGVYKYFVGHHQRSRDVNIANDGVVARILELVNHRPGMYLFDLRLIPNYKDHRDKYPWRVDRPSDIIELIGPARKSVRVR